MVRVEDKPLWPVAYTWFSFSGGEDFATSQKIWRIIALTQIEDSIQVDLYRLEYLKQVFF